MKFSLRTLFVVTTIICIAAAAAAVLCRSGPLVFGVEIVLSAALAAFCFYKGEVRGGALFSLLCLGSAICYFFVFKLAR